MIQVEKITFQYPEQAPIFKDFSWNVEAGENWTILGPSGCGKTTLLYLLAGLRFPSKGRVQIHAQLLTRPRPHTGLIIQDYGLLPWATVRQNVSLGLRIRNFYGPDGTHAPVQLQTHSSVDHWLERLNLAKHEDKYPSQLSGGQRQRTAIARTLLLEPDLILMDEPFSSLDATTRETLQKLTLELQKEQELTMVVVTHSIEEAAILGGKVLILSDPPNINPLIFDNPAAGYVDNPDQEAFKTTYDNLRKLLKNTETDNQP